MRILSFAIACPLFASLAFAQLDPYTLTVTATRSISVQPDQASLSVSVEAGLSVGLNDVLAVVQGIGLTQTNLSNLYTIFDGPSSQIPNLGWSFSLTVPYASLKNTLSQLGTLQTAQQKSGFMVTFQVTGVQVSPQLQASQTCPTAALVADATAQAQALSQAAGLGLGSISSITDGSVGPVPAPAVGVYSSVFAIATVVGIPSENVGTFYTPASSPLTCTAVVKFKLIQL